MSSAARMREMRERERSGLRLAKLTVDAERVRECLVEAGLIHGDADAETQDHALERLIDAWCRKIERRRDL